MAIKMVIVKLLLHYFSLASNKSCTNAADQFIMKLLEAISLGLYGTFDFDVFIKTSEVRAKKRDTINPDSVLYSYSIVSY